MTLEQTKEYATKILTNKWVQWVHPNLNPAQTALVVEGDIMLEDIVSHCARCIKLDGCCFVRNKCPPWPLHKNCHCQLLNISPPSIKAKCAIEKFEQYVFHPINNKGKKGLFESWGYSIMDSQYLQQEFVHQAQLAYSAGEYILGVLDDHGQRINISITLKTATGEYITFKSGWMVYPNGRIVLITPFGGRIK